MNAPRFSIATPTRNSLEKLKRCVGSVRGQKGVSYEHLIQDACSTDGTPEWLSKQKDLCAISEADTGMYDAINRAWSKSSGEFISWLNSDEQYLPDTLSTVAKFFDEHPDVDILFGDYIVATGSGKPVALRREVPYRRLYVVNSFLNMQSCTIFFRRRFFDENSMKFDEIYKYAADKDLILRMDQAGANIVHMRKYLAVFGIDGENLSAHPLAEIEAETVRLKNNAFNSRGMRGIIIIFRRLERFFYGCYIKRSLSYMYANDDVPNYSFICTEALGGSYSLQDFG